MTSISSSIRPYTPAVEDLINTEDLGQLSVFNVDCIKEIFSHLSFGRDLKEVPQPDTKKTLLVFWQYDFKSIVLPQSILEGIVPSEPIEKLVSPETMNKLTLMRQLRDETYLEVVLDIYKIALCCKTFYTITQEKRVLLLRFLPVFKESKRLRLEREKELEVLEAELERERPVVEAEVQRELRQVEEMSENLKRFEEEMKRAFNPPPPPPSSPCTIQ